MAFTFIIVLTGDESAHSEISGNHSDQLWSWFIPVCFVQIQSGQVEVLHCLLSSFHFLYANVRHGLLQHLMETYSSFCEDVDMMSSLTAHWMLNIIFNTWNLLSILFFFFFL